MLIILKYFCKTSEPQERLATSFRDLINKLNNLDESVKDLKDSPLYREIYTLKKKIECLRNTESHDEQPKIKKSWLIFCENGLLTQETLKSIIECSYSKVQTTITQYLNDIAKVLKNTQSASVKEECENVFKTLSADDFKNITDENYAVILNKISTLKKTLRTTQLNASEICNSIQVFETDILTKLPTLLQEMTDEERNHFKEVFVHFNKSVESVIDCLFDLQKTANHKS